MTLAILLSITIAVPLGVYQAYRAGSGFDRGASIAVFVAWSMPTFWFGTLLIALFAVTLRWFPVGGLQTIDTPAFDPPSRLAHLILPVCTLAIVSVAGWSRYIRGSVAETLREDYTRTAIAKGLLRCAPCFSVTRCATRSYLSSPCWADRCPRSSAAPLSPNRYSHIPAWANSSGSRPSTAIMQRCSALPY